MKFFVTGAGLWARGLTSYAAFEKAAAAGFPGIRDAVFEQPSPASIPRRERRRAGSLINLAVEVAHQACKHAGVTKEGTASVFCSAMGDTAVTDYICRKLAGQERLLSPTKFTNSVHNAASGYWTISAGSRQPSTFVGGFMASFGAALLEAVSQALAQGTPVLLVAYDVENGWPLAEVWRVRESMGLAIVIEAQAPRARPCALIAQADLEYVAEPCRPPLPRAAELHHLALGNPIGSALAVVERCAAGPDAGSTALRFPAAAHGCIELRFG